MSAHRGPRLNGGCAKSELAASAASPLHSAALVAGLLVEAVLLQSAQDAGLLELVVEAL